MTYARLLRCTRLALMYLMSVSSIMLWDISWTISRNVALQRISRCAAQPSKVAHIVPKGIRWKRLYTRSGITLLSAERASSDLPLLKGEATLDVNLYDLMAVVEDASQHTRWVPRMKISKIFERPDPFHLKAYVQFHFPWPASNRDSVLAIKVTRLWTPQHEVWVTFKQVKDAKYRARSGVVRVHRSRGYTRLRWISPTRTQVMYVVDLDPGGSLPRWLVRWMAEKFPLQVIMGLRDRVRETSGRYKRFLQQWDPRRAAQPDAPVNFSLKGVGQDEIR